VGIPYFCRAVRFSFSTALRQSAPRQQIEVLMLDILELQVQPEELEQLRQCQARPRPDCHAAFTVDGGHSIWPVVEWGQPQGQQRVNVRGWFPLLDKIADEFLIWRPQGGAFFVTQEGARYRVNEDHRPGVEFMLFELSRPTVLAHWQSERTA
jgi:hypothetical protein